MKKAFILFSALVFGAAILSGCANTPKEGEDATAENENGPKAGAIVYFNLDKVIEAYDMANDQRSVFETKAESINQEINRRGAKLEKDAKAFQDKMNKGLLTQSVAEAQYQKLQEADASFQNYRQQKANEIAEEQQVLMNQIMDAIKTFVDAYNEEMGYAMILTTQGNILPIPIVTGDEDLDITDAVIEGLNAEYVKTKAEN